ncbi:MAG: hypothetical protein EKK48_19240 [Candidatus Melainabacteria bacterium]|nr:MAG: hypothetical protein EKK48_19240 [Candidatus Melainabacteria bacterium]
MKKLWNYINEPMKKLCNYINEQWHKGPGHQWWMSFIAFFIIIAVVFALFGEYCQAASFALTAVAMVVITI